MSRVNAVQSAMGLFQAGKPEEAKATLRKHLARAPGDVGALKLLGALHGELHEDEESLAVMQRAVAVAPKDAEARFMLGNIATIVRKYRIGAEAYERTVALQPANLQAYDGLAKCLMSLGEFDRAMDWYERAIALDPGNTDTYHRMGTTLALLGRVGEGLAAARRGLAVKPDDPALLEFVVYYQNFLDGVDPRRHREEHAALGRTVAARIGAGGPFRNQMDPEKPLRVAFLSADYYFHACAFFLQGPLREFDRSRLTPFLYAHPTKRDEYTELMRRLGEWRDMSGMTPWEIRAQAERDGIDVLIDCAGWTDRLNMECCALRLAPVQATYLGYPNTTGLPGMDYRIIDVHTDPPGSEEHCTERLARLGECFLCFEPPIGAPRQEGEPPCADSGPVTFGTFNRMMKVGDRALQTWARVLREVPDSRLLIKIQIAAEEVAPNFIAKFERLGVSRDRIITSEWAKKPGEHFPMYRRMDIALDSFPYNGTTTTCEALWSGVPVVALAGSTHRARVGVSLLHAVGLTELVAADEDEYVRIAAGLAGDRARLRHYHATLRGRMEGSPLMDARGFAARFEALVRGMWREACGRHGS
ncbi:MAG: tetratricopeptide repeat protein [Leptolyngbya sp. PLA1]|nr:tetratricopeptide repeat protein [Leptolyngbya sp. PLA1]